jgi:glutamate/tyrosine decarboxylase-like PLP-dependent enzyme
VAVDPHKWLYAPLEAGARWCGAGRPAARVLVSPSYYHFDHEVTNYFDYGPQNSRGFRALKVWLALRRWVVRLSQMIGDDMRLSRRLHALVRSIRISRR